MVSFQCHACGDVVKKPKLDSHRARCHSGFDCIDCSTTFNTPADYKGHTQCISEAEKYQKGLYKGPKTKGDGGAPQNNYPPQPQGAYTDAQTQGKYRPGSKFAGRGPNWGQPRNSATGANGTPLGTPARMSPVVTPPESPTPAPAANGTPGEDAAHGVEKKSKKDKKEKKKTKDGETSTATPLQTNGDEPLKKKVRLSPQADLAPVPSTSTADAPVSSSEKVNRKKETKEKKKKDRSTHKDKAAAHLHSLSISTQGAPSALDVRAHAKDKKDKKKSKAQDEGVAAALALADSAEGPKKEKKENKNSKDAGHESSNATLPGGPGYFFDPPVARGVRESNDDGAVEGNAVGVMDVDVPTSQGDATKTKKSKEEKKAAKKAEKEAKKKAKDAARSAQASSDANAAPVPLNGIDAPSRLDGSKKRKHDAMDVDGPDPTILEKKEKAGKKDKKSKREKKGDDEAGKQDVPVIANVTVVEPVPETKSSKKRKHEAMAMEVDDITVTAPSVAVVSLDKKKDKKAKEKKTKSKGAADVAIAA